jgi:hypothetical protein
MRFPTAFAVTALLAATAAGVAGCTHDRSGSDAGEQRQDPNAAPDDLTQQITCFRAHGLPDYPDPVYDPNDGRWHLANERPALTAAVRQACASVMPTQTPASPIPASQLQDLIQFARCVRAHGVPDWPDPAVDGVFHTTISPKENAAGRVAAGTCDKYLASSGGTISLGQPDD